MVLSNKKLKQKLRSLIAQSLDTSDSAGGSANDKEAIAKELSSLKEALSNSRSQRTRPPRKRSKKNEEGNKENSETHEREVEVEEEGDGDVKNTKKKRKRERPVGVIEGEEEKGSSKKRKKKKKRKEKKKKKKRTEKEKKDEPLKEGEEEKPREDLGAPQRAESGDAAKKVYVGGIPYYSTEEDIISFFDGCGTVTEVDCMKFPESGRFRGISILTFKTDAAAKRALALDGCDMGGFYLKIQPFKPARPSLKVNGGDFSPKVIEGYNRIYVGNLSWEITEDELRSFFSGCNVSSIRFGEDKTTGEFKGYAHVDFSDEESLLAALKLEQKTVCGRPARIQCAVPLNKPTARNVSCADDTCPKSQVESKVLETDDIPAEGKKNRRRRCYNCGAPGHLSSACPQKKNDGTDDGN